VPPGPGRSGAAVRWKPVIGDDFAHGGGFLRLFTTGIPPFASCMNRKVEQLYCCFHVAAANMRVPDRSEAKLILGDEPHNSTPSGLSTKPAHSAVMGNSHSAGRFWPAVGPPVPGPHAAPSPSISVVDDRSALMNHL
jgi:hypothetical protein